MPSIAGQAMRITIVAISATLMATMPTRADEPIAPRDIGSLHIGGRLVEIKEVTITRGVPATINPNWVDPVQPIYTPYLLPANVHSANVHGWPRGYNPDARPHEHRICTWGSLTF